MVKINFKDLPDTSTPLNANNLNTMQDNIEDAIDNVEITLDSAVSTSSTNGVENQAITNYVNTIASTITSITGSITMYAGSTTPDGYLICDGSAVSRTTYSDLFNVIGTTYGNGDGSTTFNVPNLKGKVVVGLDSNDTDFDTLGETGGEKEHTLIIDEMPSHDHGHTVRNIYATNSFTQTVDAGLQVGSNGSTTSTGGGQPHNNMQPYIVLNYIIKY